MNRTRIIFVLIVLLAILIVAASLVWRSVNQPQPLTVTPRGPIQVRIVTALPIEPWGARRRSHVQRGRAQAGK